MSDITFNGYRVDLKSGASFAARATRINNFSKIAEGEYRVTQQGGFFQPYFTGTSALACLQPKQTLATTHLFQIAPYPHFYSPVAPLFLYDFSETPRMGIKTEQAFFRCLMSAKLFSPTQGYALTVKYSAPWMQTAEQELGQKEVAGSKANPRILEYFKSSKFWGKDDTGKDNAWCASFVSWVMEKHGHTPPAAAFRAKEWANFGKKIERPIYGAIGVKSRKGGGHVAFVMGKNSDGSKLYMLGGNQGDEVNVSEYAADVWETFVVPTHYDVSRETLPVYTKLSVKAGKES